MKVIGEPWKCLPWQVTKILTDEDKIKIQIKKYMNRPDGGFNFKEYKVIWCSQKEWDTFKREILLSFKQAEKIQI